MAVATRARRLRRADLSFAAAAALALARGARADCLTGSACTLIAANPADPAHTWTWSLASLCNNGRGYNFNNGTTQYRFELCGSIDPVVPALPACVGDGVTPCNVAGAQTNTYCNPEYNAYPNAGNFLHFFDPNPQTSCTYGPTSGTPAPGSAGGCPNVGGPSSATFNLPDLCCTGQCEVLSYSTPINLRPIDPANFSVGLTWTTTGNNADGADEYRCPVVPNTGYPRSRFVTHKMYCNEGGKITDPLVVNSILSNSPCSYIATYTHYAACGAPSKCG